MQSHTTKHQTETHHIKSFLLYEYLATDTWQSVIQGSACIPNSYVMGLNRRRMTTMGSRQWPQLFSASGPLL